MIFHVCSSLTGLIVGRLFPSGWDVTEPVDKPSTGTISVAFPPDYESRERLRDMLRPRVRSVVVEDDDGSLIFGGPIPRRAGKTDSMITIPVTDWRAWFYVTPLRPTAAGVRRDYIKNKTNQQDQGSIMTDLAALALEGTGRPAMVIDTAPTTGVSRQFTTKMFQRSIGEALDDIVARDRGAEWYTYMVRGDDPRYIIPHFAVAWPERRKRQQPILLDYREGEPGASGEYDWPQGEEAPTKVWAVDGTEDVQLWASAANPKIAAGNELLWEQVVNLNEGTGTVTKAYAFSFAVGAMQTADRSQGTADFTVTSERVPFGSIVAGDRVRLVMDDGWERSNLPAARIVQRVMRGGAGVPNGQVLSIDLADSRYPDAGGDPGEPV